MRFKKSKEMKKELWKESIMIQKNRSKKSDKKKKNKNKE